MPNDRGGVSPPLRVLPVWICRKLAVDAEAFRGRVRELQEKLVVESQVLDGVVVTGQEEVALLEEPARRADVVLIYKTSLGLGDCVAKIASLGLPLILFNEEDHVWTPLDALEHIYPRSNAWVALDYAEMNARLRMLQVRKGINGTKVIVLNSDYPHWENWLGRVPGGTEAIERKLGVRLEPVASREVIERWRSVPAARARPVVERWLKDAETVVEPGEGDLAAVARLYLVMRDLLNEKAAQALTMAYGDDGLPVPCFAYTNLRDERVPAACEGDIVSLLSMIILHHLAGRPTFMGNTFIDPATGVLIITHCVAPRRMGGYNTPPVPYILRNYHGKTFTGSVTAFAGMAAGQEVTVCRLSGDLASMLVARGEIEECALNSQDVAGYCRVLVRIRIDSPREFVRQASGNHQVMVYGDYRGQLRELGEFLGIRVVET